MFGSPNVRVQVLERYSLSDDNIAYVATLVCAPEAVVERSFPIALGTHGDQHDEDGTCFTKLRFP